MSLDFKHRTLNLFKESNFSIKTFSYSTLSQAVYNLTCDILRYGETQESRNGETKCLYDTNIELLNPLARHLHLEGRKNNIFGTLGEIFWVLAGKKHISPLLQFFVPRAPDYSDDGKTWHAAYGERLWDFHQIDHIISMFKHDGLLTRRATASIFIPQLDCYYYYSKNENSMKDIPCNQWLNFYCQKVNDEYFLNLKVSQRSGDIIYGTGNINIPEFTLLQEIILCCIRELYSEETINLGVYKHNVTNLHIYDKLYTQANNIQKSMDNWKNNINPEILEFYSDDLEIKIPRLSKGGLSGIRSFFKDIEELLEKAIRVIETKSNEFNISDFIDRLNYIFKKYEVSNKNNSLYVYSILCLCYIFSKNPDIQLEIENYKTEFNLDGTYNINGLLEAVKISSFRKFEIN